jgi:very-short-patch-repair endonuclease
MRSTIPYELKRAPFTVAAARRRGITWDDLQTKSWTRMSYGQYASSSLRAGTELVLRAAAQRMPSAYAFSGRTAGWIWGLDVAPCEPIVVTIPREVSVRARAGVRLRRAALPESEVVIRRSFRVTTPLRTVRDMGSDADLVESVVAIEMALRAGFVALSDIASHVEQRRGRKGIKKLRRALRLADARSESPMETRLRLELLKARLPTPCVQADLHDASGGFLGRADLYYPDRKLVIEYDGENHKDRLVSDLRRQNALLNAGYQVLRFTAPDLRTAGLVADQVRRARSRLAQISDRPDKASNRREPNPGWSGRSE